MLTEQETIDILDHLGDDLGVDDRTISFIKALYDKSVAAMSAVEALSDHALRLLDLATENATANQMIELRRIKDEIVSAFDALLEECMDADRRASDAIG